MSITASHSPLNISETVRDSLGSKGPPIGIVYGQSNAEWSRDRWRQMTPKGQDDPNTLRANNSKISEDTISNNRWLGLLCEAVRLAIATTAWLLVYYVADVCIEIYSGIAQFPRDCAPGKQQGSCTCRLC